MNRFIDWFNENANGDTYMTMLGCSREDLPVVSIVGILCVFIVAQYGDVAFHNWNVSKNHPKSNTKKYLLYFTGVFVFCLMTGYGFRVLSIWYNPYKLLALLLILLNVLTFYFRKYMRRTNAIENIYLAEKQIERKYKEVLSVFEQETLDKLSDENNDLISEEDLMSLELGKVYPIGKSSWFCVVNTLNGIDVVSWIGPDEYYGNHFHNLFETIAPRFGDFIPNKGEDVLKIGETTTYPPNKVHNPGSKTGCFIDVHFSHKKPML